MGEVFQEVIDEDHVMIERPATALNQVITGENAAPRPIFSIRNTLFSDVIPITDTLLEFCEMTRESRTTAEVEDDAAPGYLSEYVADPLPMKSVDDSLTEKSAVVIINGLCTFEVGHPITCTKELFSA